MQQHLDYNEIANPVLILPGESAAILFWWQYYNDAAKENSLCTVLHHRAVKL